MKSLEKFKEIMFDDISGIFARLRNGDYSITQEEKNEIISFAEYCNAKLKEGNLPADVAVIALEIVHSLPEYDEQEWTSLLAEEVILKMEKEIEI